MRRLGMTLFLLLTGSVLGSAQDSVVQLLERLTNAPGPSGYEEPVRKIMVELMQPLAERLSYDGLGSVIAVQGHTGPRIMLDAHMDELGGMIRRITPDGYLTMQMLGDWLDQALVDQRWTIIGSRGRVRAVTGIRDIHVAPEEETKKVPPANSMFLDVGAKSEAEVRAMGVEPGDPVVPDTPFAIMNGTQNYLAKAFDDRAGCAILVEVMRRFQHEPHPNQIFYAATVQEEIGLRGAQTSAQIIKPDIGIALEVGIVKDASGTHPEEAQEMLGEGPGFFLYDSSALPNRKLVALLKETASQKSIPLQHDSISNYGEDGAAIQTSNGGVPIVNVVVPTRYTHSHNGIINRTDLDRTVDVLVALLVKLDSKTVSRLRDFTPGP